MATAKDPVCGMEVEASETTLQSDYQGKTYYFCAPGCKRAFDQNPESYVRRATEAGSK